VSECRAGSAWSYCQRCETVYAGTVHRSVAETKQRRLGKGLAGPGTFSAAAAATTEAEYFFFHVLG
jgi:hypothetical protein